MILNPAKKNSDSEEENREDWEVLSGSKSLTSMNGQKNANEKEDGDKDDTWYKTIPATPTNTPVDTPSAPAYPTQQDGTTAGMNLAPIKEEPHPPAPPPRFDEEYTPSSSENEEYVDSVGRAVESVLQTTGRVILYVILIFALKWLWSNVRSKIQSIRAT